MHQKLYKRLIAVARQPNVTRYSDIAPLARLDMHSAADRLTIGKLLGEISTFEHQQGHPLLSAVVILKVKNIPGQRFFKLARELGRYHGSNDFMFFVQELRRVHDYWQSTKANGTQKKGALKHGTGKMH